MVCLEIYDKAPARPIQGRFTAGLISPILGGRLFLKVLCPNSLDIQSLCPIIDSLKPVGDQKMAVL